MGGSISWHPAAGKPRRGAHIDGGYLAVVAKLSSQIVAAAAPVGSAPNMNPTLVSSVKLLGGSVSSNSAMALPSIDARAETPSFSSV